MSNDNVHYWPPKADPKNLPKNHDFYDIIKSLGWSQAKVAIYLGVDERTVRRWISGEVEVNRAAFIALSLTDYIVNDLRAPRPVT